jgi:hypothetical protein
MGNTFFYDKWYKKILLLLCLTSDSLNRPYTDGSCLSSHGCCCFYQVKQVIFKHWDSFFSDWEKERKSIIIIRGGDQISFFLFENGSREQEEKKVMDWKYCAAFLLLWPLHNKHPKMGAHTHTHTRAQLLTRRFNFFRYYKGFLNWPPRSFARVLISEKGRPG